MSDQQDTPKDDGPLNAVVAGRATIVDETAAENERTGGDEAQPAANGEQDTPDNTDSEQERLYAGRYKDVDGLEDGYKSLQAEFTRTQQRLKELEGSNAAPKAPEDNPAIDPELDAQLRPYLDARLAPVQEELEQRRTDELWSSLKAEYGKDIDGKVYEYFQTLSERERSQLDNPAGARLIAKIVGKKAEPKPNASQPAGMQRSAEHRNTSGLTRAKIDSMSPDEYTRRQSEIMAYYQSLQN